jgi:hypothetical protein
MHEFSFATITVDFAPNESFSTTLVQLWKQKWDFREFLVEIDFAPNETFFYYISTSWK